MKIKVGYSIHLSLDYEGDRALSVVYWLHGRAGTESSDEYSIHLSDVGAPPKVPPIIAIHVSDGSQANYCDSFDGIHGRTESLSTSITVRLHRAKDRRFKGMFMGGFDTMRACP